MREILRKSGIDVIGDVPWGTHFCQFYQTKEDLVDILVPYLKAGLENNEYCIWVISKPFDFEDAKAALKRAIPDLNIYLEKGQIAIIPQACWYLKKDVFDSEKALCNLVGKFNHALHSGYDGLRFSEDRSWLKKENWNLLIEYEKQINNVIDNCLTIALCSYSLNKCSATEIIDVVANHQFSLVKKEGEWERTDNFGWKNAEKTVQAKKNLENTFDAVLDSSAAHYKARAGEAICPRENQYQFLYENSLDGILLTKPDGTILSANPQACQMFGMTEDEIIRAGRKGVVVKDEKLAAALEDRERTGRTRAELTFIRKDGSAFICDTTSKLFVDAYGNIHTCLIIRDISERKQTEEALRDSEEKFRGLVEHVNDWVWEIGTDFVYTYVSPRACELLGYEPADLLGTTPFNYMNSEEAERVRSLFDLIFNAREEFSLMENTLIRKDGSTVTVEKSGVPIYDCHGNFSGYRGIDRNITDRKLAEAEVQEARNMLQLIMDNIPQGIFWKDRNSRYRGCNKVFAKASGMESSENIVGKTDYDLPWPPEQIEWFLEYDRKIMENDTPEYHIIEPQREANGELVWIETNKIPLHDDKGNVIGVLGTYEKITERKRAEEALRLSSLYNRSLIEASLDPLITIGQDGKITDVNSATEHVTGYSRNDLIGTDFSDYFTEPEKARTGYQQVFIDGEVRDYPLDIRHKDGHTTPVLYNASVYRDENGEVIGVFAAARDITESKKAEKALQVSEERYRSLYENSLDGILLTKPDGTILSANPQACHMFGMSEDEIIQAGRDGLLVKDEKLAAALEERELTGRMRAELAHRRKDGSTFICDTTSRTFVDTDGSISTSLIIRDITERKRAEEALLESESRLRLAQVSAGAGIWDWDMSTDKLDWSEELFQLFGLDPKKTDASFDSWRSVLHPDDRLTAEKRIETAVKNRTSLANEYRIVLPSSEVRWINALGNTTFDSDGNPQRMSGICIDITERKQAEEALRLSNIYNRSLIEASLDPLVTIGPDGKITDVNGATEQVTGCSRNDLIGTDFSDYFTEPEKARTGYQQVFKYGKVWDYPLEIQHKDGHITPVLYNASVYRDENGEIIGVFAAARDITERKKAEEALKKAHDNLEKLVEERTIQLEKAYNSLKESEEGLSEAQKIAQVGNWEWDIATGKTRWSDELYSIFGLYPQGSTPTSDEFFAFIHPDDREYVVNAIKAALKGKPYGGIDYRIILANREERIVHAKSEVVFNEGNSPVRVKGIIQDITGRKKTEEKIQTLANAVESSNDAIITESLDGIITSWNKAAEQIYGYSAEEILGKKVSILEPNNVKGEIKSFSEMIKQGKKVQHYETLRLRKDGKIISISVTLSPIFNSSGELVALSAIVRDITERKREEKALRESEARLRRFYESDMFGVLYYNADGSINDANDKFLEIVGYTREDLRAGKVNWKKMTPPEYRPLDEHAVAELKTTGRNVIREKEYIRKDGSHVPIILGAATFDPECQEGIAFVLDNTERKKAEKALDEMDRIRIKEIHHRIKNNLQVISSLLDLQAEKFQDKEVLEAFRESQNRVVSMSLIHEELYKGEGNDALDFSAYLRELAKNLFQTYSLSSKNIRLFMDLEEDAFFDMDTAVPLGIIVNELVSNSLKHAFNEGKEGEVRIRLCREKKKDEKNKSLFSLTISDNGKGIPEDIELGSLESLGLQLVNILVDQLDGEIGLKREQGTEFRITLNMVEKNNDPG